MIAAGIRAPSKSNMDFIDKVSQTSRFSKSRFTNSLRDLTAAALVDDKKSTNKEETDLPEVSFKVR